MLYLLISCLSFILLFTHKAIQACEAKLKLLPLGFRGGFSSIFASWFQKSRFAVALFQPITFKLKMMMNFGQGTENAQEEIERLSLLDLPDLTLECILLRLSPSGLCTMGRVCTALRESCRSDHLWENHVKKKWGRLIGDAAYGEWQLYVASRSRMGNFSDQSKQKGLLECIVSSVWPFSWIIRPKASSDCKVRISLPVDSIKSMYLSLESGKFWFPAQVYNRENNNVGFLLSCYDAQVSYDSQTNTFQARYSPYGRRATEDSIPWDRLRAAPIDTPSYNLHVSDCLHDLTPGDHIEIQWRRSKEFPYGWWYGVIGHFKFCDGNENRCGCHYNDIVVLEFSQYSLSSRWRQIMINRKDHREVGNEADGFYGGIRKLYNVEEIEKWKRLWPIKVLE